MTDYRVEIVQRLSSAPGRGSTATNVVYFSGAENPQNLTDHMANVFTGNYETPDDQSFSLYNDRLVTATAYDLAQPKPRPEAAQSQAGGGIPTLSNPRVLASCLSYYANRNLNGQRGRLYIGPFSVATDSASVPQTIISNLMGLGDCLGETYAHAGFVWKLYSPTHNTLANITNYWTDDKWDVMHSRETAASQRDTGVVPTAPS